MCKISFNLMKFEWIQKEIDSFYIWTIKWNCSLRFNATPINQRNPYYDFYCYLHIQTSGLYYKRTKKIILFIHLWYECCYGVNICVYAYIWVLFGSRSCSFLRYFFIIVFWKSGLDHIETPHAIGYLV